MRENTVRKPTTQELELLKEYYKGTGQDEETANKIINNSWFAVFDSDISIVLHMSGHLLLLSMVCLNFTRFFTLKKIR